MGDLDHIWRSRGITWRLKGKLFSSLVLSVMLYNAEVWPLRADDVRMLDGAYAHMLRSVVLREARANSPKQRTEVCKVKLAQIRERMGLPDMAALLRQKRLRWIGHALRRSDGDTSKEQVRSELKTRSTWAKSALADMKELGFKTVQDLEAAARDKEAFRERTSAHT